MLNKILFNGILLFSLTANAVLKETFYEVMEIVNKHCVERQYFRPSQRVLILADLPGNIIGQCSTNERTFWKIMMDKWFWEHKDNDAKFQVMAHEVMHCIFFQDHIDNPKHFMYYSFNKLTKKEIITQIGDLAKDICKDGK